MGLPWNPKRSAKNNTRRKIHTRTHSEYFQQWLIEYISASVFKFFMFFLFSKNCVGVWDFLCKESAPARIQLTGNASSLLSFRVYIILAPYPVNFFSNICKRVKRNVFFSSCTRRRQRRRLISGSQTNKTIQLCLAGQLSPCIIPGTWSVAGGVRRGKKQKNSELVANTSTIVYQCCQ